MEHLLIPLLLRYELSFAHGTDQAQAVPKKILNFVPTVLKPMLLQSRQFYRQPITQPSINSQEATHDTLAGEDPPQQHLISMATDLVVHSYPISITVEGTSMEPTFRPSPFV